MPVSAVGWRSGQILSTPDAANGQAGASTLPWVSCAILRQHSVLLITTQIHFIDLTQSFNDKLSLAYSMVNWKSPFFLEASK